MQSLAQFKKNIGDLKAKKIIFLFNTDMRKNKYAVTKMKCYGPLLFLHEFLRIAVQNCMLISL